MPKAKKAALEAGAGLKESWFYLVTGSNELAVKEEARKLADRLGRDLGPFGVEIIDGAVEKEEEVEKAVGLCLEALRTMPFLGGGKLVWLKDALFLAPPKKARGSEDEGPEDETAPLPISAAGEGIGPKGKPKTLGPVERLTEAVLAGVSPGVKFLVSAPAVDARKRFFKAAEKIGVVRQFEGVDDTRAGWQEKVEEFIQDRLRGQSLKIDPDAALCLAEMVGADFLMLKNELEKLTLYAHDRQKITVDDVQAICSSSREQIHWDLADAVAGRKPARALKILERLLFQGENPIALLFGLINRMRLVLLTQELVEQKIIRPARTYWDLQKNLQSVPESVRESLPQDKKINPLTAHPFVLFKSLEVAPHFTRFELIKALELLFEANHRMVSGGDQKLVLTAVIAQITGR